MDFCWYFNLISVGISRFELVDLYHLIFRLIHSYVAIDVLTIIKITVVQLYKSIAFSSSSSYSCSFYDISTQETSQHSFMRVEEVKPFIKPKIFFCSGVRSDFIMLADFHQNLRFLQNHSVSTEFLTDLRRVTFSA